jgi:prepilin-type N-terminal cleavage/methylation domain-containing protein
MSHRAFHSNRRRRGFTLPEMLLIVVMIGILTMIGVPKFRIFRDRSNVNAVRARIEAMIATSRASAIHKGRLSVFLLNGDSMSVWTRNPTTAVWEQQVKWQNYKTTYPTVQVQLGGAGWSSVYYEPRGLTWSGAKPPSMLVFRVKGRTRTDSVCVSRLGHILPPGCTL